MDEEAESLTVGYISIAGIDRQELIKALYEHAMDHDQAQIDLSGGTEVGAARLLPFFSLSDMFSRFKDSKFTPKMVSAKRADYIEGLKKFTEKYHLNLDLNRECTNTICTLTYDAAYGEGASQSVFDKLLEEIETKRKAEACYGELKRRSSQESQKVSAGLPADSHSKDDEVTIHFNPACNPPSSSDRKGSDSLDIFSPRKDDK